jgi:mercuric reductase
MAKPPGDHFDLLILGSGSTAFAAALRARELGKTTLMAEERVIGGTCVNRGCLPSKNLIEAAKLVHDARVPRYAGIGPTTPGVGLQDLIDQKDELVRAYRGKKYESLLGDSVEVARGHAELLDHRTIKVGDKRFTGNRVLIATGSRPVRPPVDGLEGVPYLTSDLLTSDEPVELRELPPSLLVLGGGYVALELGQMFQRLGSEVTIVERGEEPLSRGYEPEVGPTIRRILEQEGISVLTSARVTAVRKDGDGVVAAVEARAGTRQLRAARLLVATGRRPNTDAIGIEKAGVEVGAQGQVRVDRHLRTNVSHVFAAGDVIVGEHGSQMATPVGSQDGGVAAHNAFRDDLREVDHRVVPRAIFTDPPVAVVGLTEEQAIAAGRRCWCNTLPMSLVPRAAAIRDTRGIVKMVADAETHEVLGVTMIGHGAAEVIHEAAMGLRFRATLLDFIGLLHVYPTMAEALKIAATSRFKDPERLSCCAE